MLAPLVLIAVGVMVWWLMAPGLKFLPEFSSLLTTPTLEGRALGLLTGRSFLTGQFNGRHTAVRLQLKRNRYSRGYLVVALRTGGPTDMTYDDIDRRARDESARRSLFTLAKEEVRINVEDGWLKALWEPAGFVIFPGTFSAEKWRAVLGAMDTLAASLEAKELRSLGA